MQTYELEQADGMTLFIALSEIREKQDPSLQFDFVCRAGICGSCAMVINGRPGLACRTLTAQCRTRDHAAAAAGVRADRRSLGQHRQVDARDERAPRGVGAHERGRARPAAHRGAHGARARREDLRARPLHRMRMLRVGLRHRAHARGFRRRGGPQQGRALPTRPARHAQPTTTSTRSSATTTACSAACRCWPATTCARSSCRSRRRSRSCAGR